MALKGASPEHEGEERPTAGRSATTSPPSAAAGASTPSEDLVAIGDNVGWEGRCEGRREHLRTRESEIELTPDG